MTTSIPVICDRCRAIGVAGGGDFTHLGDLLEFDPVPRKTKRSDGWTPDRQRAFIAALSATGSPRLPDPSDRHNILNPVNWLRRARALRDVRPFWTSNTGHSILRVRLTFSVAC